MKVLLLDELEIIRDGLELLLRDFFTIERITHASDGWEALKKAKEDSYHLMVMDLDFTGELAGGHTFLNIKKLLPEAKVVIFSMHNEGVYQRAAFMAGADGFLEKKLKGEEIIKALMAIFDGHKVFDEEMIHERISTKGKQHDILELPISQREREVFVLTVQGFSQKEIAEKMEISIRTVENHRQHIGKKLGTNKKKDWVEIAQRHHLTAL